MSKAEEAAGHEAWLSEFPDRRGFWDKLTDEDRAYWIDEGMRIVRAHDAERFRKPREPEDWESWEDLLVIYWENGQWCGPFYGPLHDNAPKDPAIPVMIADPIPLPPAPGGGEK